MTEFARRGEAGLLPATPCARRQGLDLGGGYKHGKGISQRISDEIVQKFHRDALAEQAYGGVRRQAAQLADSQKPLVLLGCQL